MLPVATITTYVQRRSCSSSVVRNSNWRTVFAICLTAFSSCCVYDMRVHARRRAAAQAERARCRVPRHHVRVGLQREPLLAALALIGVRHRAALCDWTQSLHAISQMKTVESSACRRYPRPSTGACIWQHQGAILNAAAALATAVSSHTCMSDDLPNVRNLESCV
jgi:hypothetical protein